MRKFARGKCSAVKDVLERGIIGLFSDWPGTTTFYANCLK
jgi:glycerophosphoryl diester phosphodiesterase